MTTNTINYIGYNASNHGSQVSSSEDESLYTPPSPRKYFSHFVKAPKQLIEFIEAIVKSRIGIEIDMNSIKKCDQLASSETLDHNDASALMTTLLEVYLKVARNVEDEKERDDLRSKSLTMIENHDKIPIDLNHALMTCTLEDYDEGKLKIWCILGLYEEVVYHYIELCKSSDTKSIEEEMIDQVIKSIELHGMFIPHMYMVVLRFLVDRIKSDSKRLSDIQKILNEIDEKKIELNKKGKVDESIKLPEYSEIIETISKAGVQIGAIKDWIIRKVSEDEEKSRLDELLFRTYREESRKKENKLKELGDGNKAQSFQNTRCASTGDRLELPAIHFACGHSYNVTSLADNESECPLCARSHGVIRELRKNQKDLIERHDIFLNGVKTEGFDLISLNFANKLF